MFQWRRQRNRTASLTINPDVDHPGTLFTNQGASGGITFTLPAANRRTWKGVYGFISVTDDNVTVATATADTGISLHELDADSVAASTSSQKIGSFLMATCVETTTGVYAWHIVQIANGVTATVTD